MSQPRWMGCDEIERWDRSQRRAQFSDTTKAKDEYRDLSLALLELFEDAPAEIRPDIPEHPAGTLRQGRQPAVRSGRGRHRSAHLSQ